MSISLSSSTVSLIFGIAIHYFIIAQLLIEYGISSYRLYFAIQLCAIRLQGGFLTAMSELSPRIINYLSSQFDLPLTFFVNEPFGGQLAQSNTAKF